MLSRPYGNLIYVWKMRKEWDPTWLSGKDVGRLGIKKREKKRGAA